MPITAVDICNDALSEIGESTITTLADNTVRARLCNQFYEKAVDFVLRSGNWNCATKRAALVQNVTAPVWGFDYAFDLPDDWMRTISTSLDLYGYRWVQENKLILTDETEVNLKYVYQLTDPDLWDAQLTQAVIYYMAFKLSGGITEKEAKKKLMFELYTVVVNQAKGTSGQEGTPEEIDSDVLIQARNV